MCVCACVRVCVCACVSVCVSLVLVRLKSMEKGHLTVADTFEQSATKYPSKTAIHHVNTDAVWTFKALDEGRVVGRCLVLPFGACVRVCKEHPVGVWLWALRGLLCGW
jgi:hypothetical protein